MSEGTKTSSGAEEAGAGDELIEIRVVGLPIGIAEAATAHNEALRREFQLIHEADAAEQASVPARLLALVAELRDRFGALGEEQRNQFLAAVAAGRESIDLTYRVPPALADAVRHLASMLDEADDFCREGDALLTLASTPDSIDYRHWFLGEFIRQIEGQPPLSWADFRAGTHAGAGTGSGNDGDGDGDGDAPVDDGIATPSPAGPPSAGGPEDDEAPPGPLPAGWSLTVDDGIARLELAADLDIESAPALRSALRQLRQTGASRLDIDATRVTFLDSVGMSVLITGHLRFTEDGTAYTLAVSEEMRRTLEITGLLSRLSIV